MMSNFNNAIIRHNIIFKTPIPKELMAENNDVSYKFEINNDKPKNDKNNTIVQLISGKMNIPYPVKYHYHSVIPLNIFQTWHSKTLPPLMTNAVNTIISVNPRFKYYLYDDNDCRDFIKNSFPENVLEAYDALIPGAYKADLWRYCILYKEGGIYLDIKYKPINQFKFINLTEKEHWVLDMDNYGIYNALIVTRPGNSILLKAIEQIVENVKKKYHGANCLEPTGPHLLAKYFNKQQKNSFDMKHNFINDFNNRFIYFNNYMILKSYNGYLDEHQHNKKVDHYGHLWNNRKIYK